MSWGTTHFNDGWGAGLYGAGLYGVGTTDATTNIGLWSTAYTRHVHIRNANVWQFVENPTTFDNFSLLGFQLNNTAATVKIDEIMLYQYYRTSYQGNIKEINYTVGSSLVDVTLGYFDEQLNDDFFNLEKQVEAIQESLST
jgi:hypothetical protein